MHIENIIKMTLGIKDHCIVEIESGTDNIIIHLDVIKRRKFPCGHCVKRAKVVDRVPKERYMEERTLFRYNKLWLFTWWSVTMAISV